MQSVYIANKLYIFIFSWHFKLSPCSNCYVDIQIVVYIYLFLFILSTLRYTAAHTHADPHRLSTPSNSHTWSCSSSSLLVSPPLVILALALAGPGGNGVWHWKLLETQTETRSTKRTKFYLRVELAICAIALPEWTCLFWHDDGSAGHTKASAERVLECCYHMASSNFGYGYGFYFSFSSCFSQLPKVNCVCERRNGRWARMRSNAHCCLFKCAHTLSPHLCPRVYVYGCIGYLSGRAYLGVGKVAFSGMLPWII